MAGSQPINFQSMLPNLPQPELPTPAPDPAPAPVAVQATAPAPVAVPATAMATASTSAPVSSTPNRTAEHLMHKNRLQEYAQRSSIPLPAYQTVNEGFQHAPKFRASVLVDGVTYTSSNTFSHRKAAEQDVAKLALECISRKLKDEGCPLVNEDTIFCKSILNEFAVKMNLQMPTYNTIQTEGLLPVFVSSLVFNGVSYTGETGRNKKEAEQLAARAVIRSLLGTSGSATILYEIIKSKAKLYAALNKVRDSYYSTQNIAISNVPTAAVPEANVAMHPAAAVPEAIAGTHPTASILEPRAGMHLTAAVPGASTAIHPTAAIPEASAGMHPTIPEASAGILPIAAILEASTVTYLTAAVPEASTGMNLPHHQFKRPKTEPSSEIVDLSISFVPPVSEQTSGVGPSSTNKRRKNKKKANKKLGIDPQLCTAAQPLTQAPSCSVAQ